MLEIKSSVKIKIDLHTHPPSRVCNIYQIIKSGLEKNLEILGVTPHGPSRSSIDLDEFLGASTRIPSKIEEMSFFRGVEANILDEMGNLDITENNIQKTDYIIFCNI